MTSMIPAQPYLSIINWQYRMQQAKKTEAAKIMIYVRIGHDMYTQVRYMEKIPIWIAMLMRQIGSIVSMEMA